MCMSILLACMQRPEEGIRSSGMGVTDNCELPCGCWESNPGSMGDLPGLLTVEIYLWPLAWILNEGVLYV